MSPEQYAVINYLAYSWLERGVNLPRVKKNARESSPLKQVGAGLYY